MRQGEVGVEFYAEKATTVIISVSSIIFGDIFRTVSVVYSFRNE